MLKIDGPNTPLRDTIQKAVYKCNVIILTIISLSSGSKGRRCLQFTLLEVTSRYGSTIMHTACKQGHLDIVHVLHDLCPRLLVVKNTKGLTPLHYACRGNYAEVAEELCIMLQKVNAHTNIKYQFRNPP